MMKISLDELFTDKPELVEMAKGLLEFLHLKLEIMASVIGSLTEMLSGDFEEIETQFGEKTNRCKTTHILNEEYLLDQILFSNLEVVVILMWKQHHADEPIDIAGLDEKLIACRKVWGPLCDVLIERTEGADAALRLKEEVSDFMDSLMFVFYANKVTDDLTEFTRHRDRIKATLREITSELIKVEARKAEAARLPRQTRCDEREEIIAESLRRRNLKIEEGTGRRVIYPLWVATKSPQSRKYLN